MMKYAQNEIDKLRNELVGVRVFVDHNANWKWGNWEVMHISEHNGNIILQKVGKKGQLLKFSIPNMLGVSTQQFKRGLEDGFIKFI